MQTGLRPIHPGEFLAEILNELEISQAAFARLIDVAPMRISHVIGGSRPVTADLALRFAKAFNQTPQYWLNLQTAYDLAVPRRSPEWTHLCSFLLTHKVRTYA
jgi:addiction module HigA family antidote